MAQRDTEVCNPVHSAATFSCVFFFSHFKGLEKNQYATEITPSSNDYFCKLIKKQNIKCFKGARIVVVLH